MDTNQNCKRILADEVQIKSCKKLVVNHEDGFERLSKVLSLAGNKVRLKILFLLETEKELCPCDFSDILEMSIPAISQHLRKLKDGNIVVTRRAGQTIYYSLNETHNSLLKPLFNQIVQQTQKVSL